MSGDLRHQLTSKLSTYKSFYKLVTIIEGSSKLKNIKSTENDLSECISQKLHYHLT